MAPPVSALLQEDRTTQQARVANSHVCAGYMALQAFAGVLFWAVLWSSPAIREVFELVPSRPAVTDAFFLADLVVGVGGSAVAAWGFWTGARWAVTAAAFATGGILYATLFLACWVPAEGTGAATLAIMLPPSALSSWVTWRAWRLGPRGAHATSTRA